MRWVPVCWVLVIGCAKPDYSPVPVNGKVTLDGKPLAEADVRFVGDGFNPPLSHAPNSTTDKEGAFRLNFTSAGDGAPPGKYKIGIALHAKDEQGYRTGPNTLPAKFANPETSGLTAEVKPAGPNEIPPFEITSR